MGRPWGLSGPDFLLLYGIALVAAVGVATVVRLRVRRVAGPAALPVGDTAMLAYLVGGARQVVQTSLARLIDRGAVRVTRDGTLTATVATVPDPIDQAVLHRIGNRARRADDVLQRAADLPPITDLANRCAALGLLIDGREDQRARRRGLIAPYVLLGVGIARLYTGLAGNYPVGFLLVEILVTVVAIAVLHQWGKGTRARYTTRGRRVLAAGRRSDDAATLVAIGGLAAYPNSLIATAMGFPEASQRGTTVSGGTGCGGSVSSYGCGSSGGSSGGSSCGGGGGCGGGGT